MTNELAETLKAVKTAGLSEGQRDKLDRALFTVAWAGKTCKTLTGGEDGIRVISPAELARTTAFRHLQPSPKAAVDETLLDLARLKVCSEPELQPSTGGKRAILVYLWEQFSPGGRFSEAEIEQAVITRFMIDQSKPGQVVHSEPEPPETAAATVIGVTPSQLSHFIEPPAPPPAPLPVSFLRHATSPVEPRLPTGFEVRALFDFSMVMAGQVLSFKKGAIIEDYFVSRQAVADNMPVVLLGKEDGRQYCPRCHAVFERKELSGDERQYLRPLADLMFSFSGQILRFEITDIITAPILVAWMLSQPNSFPCVIVEPGQHFNLCPGCGHTYSLQTKDL